MFLTKLVRSGLSIGARQMASLSVSTRDVQHDEKKHKFYIPIDGSQNEALLSYTMQKDGVIDLQHTFVPEEFRGKGVGALLVEKALDYAAENNLKPKLTCWYTTEYVEQNREKISQSPSLRNLEFL